MKFTKSHIVIIIGLVIAIVSAILTRVWSPCSIFFGVGLLIASATFSVIRYKKYKELQQKFWHKRYVDAYLYADETGAEFDANNFSYTKKDEKEIKNILNNSKILLYTGYTFCVISIVMVFVGIFH